ncbi:hypothetical protein [Pantoea sp. BAV 3049]|nr:hypothetical protein [Pantoea sp. BAV 3049]
MSVEDYNALEHLKRQSLRNSLARSIAQAQTGNVAEGDVIFDGLMKDL